MHTGKQPPLDLPRGYRVGDWSVIARIGDGSWGSVYAAEHTRDQTQAAIKVLRTDLLTPAQRTSMDELMHREVRFSLTAEHPNIVRTYAVVTLQDSQYPELDGVTALIMDRAERSLEDLLTNAAPGTPMPNAADLLTGISAGLAHVHTRGWVHGDLKPANILLANGNRVWLADFGLSAELDGTHAYVPPLGSLDHVPPEWWSQRPSLRGAPLRPSADIWAFGVVAHQILTGGLHPFPGGTARARAIAAGSYARGRERLRLDNAVPPEWRPLITDCLRPDHESRAALTAQDLAKRVHSLRSASPPARSPLGMARWTLGSAWLVGVAALVTLLAGDAASSQEARTPVGSGPIAGGSVRTFQNIATKACMDDSDKYGLRGYPCNGFDFQKWRIRDVTAATQHIENTSTRKCLYDDGVVLTTQRCSTAQPLSWVVLANEEGTFSVRSRDTGKCLHDGIHGLQTLPCRLTSDHQRWHEVTYIP
ncbi:protein kinase domain-containing protein [Streptomyces boninensis]|uniref:serine/threonine-protein kinase n=1 Tax=Streptomyces boninensis TaxID=2039455 RepID=UPI003B21764C